MLILMSIQLSVLLHLVAAVLKHRRPSALALLVARVVADDHHVAVATDDLALVTDALDAGVDLHCSFLRWRRTLAGRSLCSDSYL